MRFLLVASLLGLGSAEAQGAEHPLGALAGQYQVKEGSSGTVEIGPVLDGAFFEWKVVLAEGGEHELDTWWGGRTTREHILSGGSKLSPLLSSSTRAQLSSRTGSSWPSSR